MSEHELWNELGNLYFMSGAYKQASHAYERSIKLENRSGRPHSNLAFTYVQQGKHAEAVELLRTSIELLSCDREKAISWYRLGDVYRRIKDYRDAILAYQQADQLDPSISQSEEEIGQVLYGASDLVSAPDFGQRAIIEEKPATDEPSASASLIPDSSTPGLTDPHQAQDAEANQAVAEEPPSMQDSRPQDDLEPSVLSPEIQDDLPDWEEENFHEIEETELLEWLFQTESIPREESGSQPEFVERVEHEQASAAALPAASPGILQGAAILPASSGATQTDTLVRTDFRNVTVVEENAPLQAVFVVPEENLSELEGRETELNPASLITVQAPDPKQNEIDLEIEKFQRMVEDDPHNAAAWEAFGNFYKSVQMYKEALFAYQQALSNDPQNVHYLHCVGITYAIEGCVEDAIRTLQEIIIINPNHALAHATLGGYYRKMGMEELAQKHIEKAMKNFFDTENEYNRACMQALCGRVEEAIALLRIALEKKQTYVDWVVHDPDLEAIRNDPSFKQLISDFI